MFRGFKQRRPWASGVIALLFGPVIAMLYLGRWRYALGYFLAGIFFSFFLYLPTPRLDAPLLATLMILAAAVSNLILHIIGIFHAIYVARKRERTDTSPWYGRWFVLLAVIAARICLMIYLTFAYQAAVVVINSASMAPTLGVRDGVIVERYLRLSSSPTIFETMIERGNIVAFDASHDSKTMRLGRVIGLPGDRIAIKEGILSINGQSAKRAWLKDYRCKSARCQRQLYRQYSETLPDAFIDPYRVIDTIDGGTGENLAEFTVPPGYYFILGDHRDHQENDLSEPGHGLIARDQLFGILSYRYFRGYNRKVELELIP